MAARPKQENVPKGGKPMTKDAPADQALFVAFV